MTLDIDKIIKTSKLGRARKDAQTDSCGAFAAALYDALETRGIHCRLFTAKGGSPSDPWYHAVVKVDDIYYDSMGEFSEEIWRARAKIHPTVKTKITYKQDSRPGCYEEEFDEFYAFYIKMLNKAIEKEIENEYSNHFSPK